MTAQTAAKPADIERLFFSEQFELKAAAEGSEGEGIVEGYASRFGEKDDGNDIVVRGAFKNSLQKRGKDWVPFLYGHNRQGLPVGYFLDLYEDGQGLKFKAKLLLKTEAGKALFELAQAGVKMGISIGYRTVKKEISVPGSAGGQDASEYSPGAIRKLLEVELLEISAVPIPMLRSATITSAKDADGGEAGAEAAEPCEAKAQADGLVSMFETETQSLALTNAIRNAAVQFGR